MSFMFIYNCVCQFQGKLSFFSGSLEFAKFLGFDRFTFFFSGPG